MSRKKPKSSSDQDESKTSIPAVETWGNPIAAAAAAAERSNQNEWYLLHYEVHRDALFVKEKTSLYEKETVA